MAVHPEPCFDDFDRARFAFEEALQLWHQNTDAVEGLEETKLKYAQYAYDQQVYARGIDLLDRANDTHRPMLAKLDKALQDQRDAEQKSKIQKRINVALVVAVAVGAILWGIDRTSKEAKANRNEKTAIANKKDAVAHAVVAINSTLQAKGDVILRGMSEIIAEEQKDRADLGQLNALESELEAINERSKAEDSKEDAERSSYRYEIGQASDEIRRNAFDMAEEILGGHEEVDAVRAAARGWEWGYLHQLTRNRAFPFSFDGLERVESVAMSKDQRWIAAGSRGSAKKQLHFWRRIAGEWLPLRIEHGSSVQAVAISSDGTLAASASELGVRVWRLPKGDGDVEIRHYTDLPMPGVNGSALSLSFKGSQSLLAGTDTGHVLIWDMNQIGQNPKSWKVSEKPVRTARFSPMEDQPWIVTAGDDGRVAVWNVEKTTASQDWHPEHRQPVYAAEFSPDGNQIVSGGRDRRLLVWRFNQEDDVRQERLQESMDRLEKEDYASKRQARKSAGIRRPFDRSRSHQPSSD